MVFQLILPLLFCSVYSQQARPYHAANVTFEKDHPVHLPEKAGKNVHFEEINGTLYSDSFSQLDITDLELELANIEKIESGSVCSAPSLQKLSLYLGTKPITLTKEVLQNCEKLQTLIVTGFYYRHHKIEPDAFENFPNLKQLVIFYINVQHVTKQHFQNLSKLEELTLRDCFIEEIDSDSFDNLHHLKVLQVITRGYSNHKSTLLLQVQKTIENVSFTGLRGPLKPLQFNVTNLNLEFSDLENIESGVIFPPSLKKLDFVFKSSQKITLNKEFLKGCENLEDLVVSVDYRNPSSVDLETFQNLPKLKNVDLTHLEIRHVTKETFKNSLALERISLCDDSVRTLDIDAFDQMKNLKEVTVCFYDQYGAGVSTEPLLKNTIKVNKLTYKKMQGKLYIPHLDVKELHLHFDNLREIETGSICASPTLKKFELHFHSTGPIFTKDVLNCGNLEELTLKAGGSRTNRLPIDIFENLHNLKSLHLENFNFSTVKREYFGKLPNLEKLVLQECNVNNFEDGAFDDLQNLKGLQISSSSHLSHIPKNLFKNKGNLKKLLLFGNDIKDLTWDEFKGLTSLETLSVRGNSIESFNSEKIAKNIPNLKQIDISLNNVGREEYYSFVEELSGKLPVEFAILTKPFL